MDVFLNLDQDVIKKDFNTISDLTICLKNPLVMGLFPNNQLIINPGFSYSVSKCKNTSENNFYSLSIFLLVFYYVVRR